MPPRLKLAYMDLTEEDWQQFQRMGDLNRDGKIDDTDAKILIDAFNARPSDANWNPIADLDGDGWIGPNDILILGDNYGLDIWTWKGTTKPMSIPALIGIGALALLLLLI